MSQACVKQGKSSQIILLVSRNCTVSRGVTDSYYFRRVRSPWVECQCSGHYSIQGSHAGHWRRGQEDSNMGHWQGTAYSGVYSITHCINVTCTLMHRKLKGTLHQSNLWHSVYQNNTLLLDLNLVQPKSLI